MGEDLLLEWETGDKPQAEQQQAEQLAALTRQLCLQLNGPVERGGGCEE